MEYTRLRDMHFPALCELHAMYKEAIGEDRPTQSDLDRMISAIADGSIIFYGCIDDGRLVACCSVSPVFSTFDYKRGGVFEDFFILPEYRHSGIARQLVGFAYRDSGVSTFTVGCADCDTDMYAALGFSVRIGNLLAYEN